MIERSHCLNCCNDSETREPRWARFKHWAEMLLNEIVSVHFEEAARLLVGERVHRLYGTVVTADHLEKRAETRFVEGP